MNKIVRTLLLMAVILWLVDSLFGSAAVWVGQVFDTFVTLVLLATIWLHIRHRSRKQVKRPSERTAHPVQTSADRQQSSESSAPQRDMDPPPKILPATWGGFGVIYHHSPWSVVERGQVLGKFRNARICAWIRTSDKRIADYAGVQAGPYPEQCLCIEIPEKSELILPPGMIYTIRPSA